MYKVTDFKEPQKHSRSRRCRLGHHHCLCVMDSRAESIDSYTTRGI